MDEEMRSSEALPGPLRSFQGDATLGIADLHIHSDYGDGLASPAQILEHVWQNTTLSVIAITDHDDIAASFDARELAARWRCPVEVVTGMEVTTLEGHLLAFFMESPVPSLRSLERTIEAVHHQGGLCVVPHPMSWLTRSVGQRALERICERRSSDIYFDGLEAINAAPGGQVRRKAAQRLNRQRLHLSETGGSDAHFLEAVGAGYTLFPGAGAEDLRRSILEGTTRAGGGTPMKLMRIGIGRLVRQQSRGLVVLPLRLLLRTLGGRSPRR